MFDADGDGTIDTSELGIVLRSIGQNPTEQEVADMINSVDDDNNGCCEFDEFLYLMSTKLNKDSIEEEMKEAFKTFDKKDTGYISIDDLKETMAEYNEALTDDDARLLFEMTDVTGKLPDGSKKGKLEFKDFIIMMMAK